jgi:hypothetical protein
LLAQRFGLTKTDETDEEESGQKNQGNAGDVNGDIDLGSRLVIPRFSQRFD